MSTSNQKEIDHCDKRIAKYESMKAEYLNKLERGNLPEDSLKNAIDVCDHYISAIKSKKEILASY